MNSTCLKVESINIDSSKSESLTLTWSILLPAKSIYLAWQFINSTSLRLQFVIEVPTNLQLSNTTLLISFLSNVWFDKSQFLKIQSTKSTLSRIIFLKLIVPTMILIEKKKRIIFYQW